VVSEAGKHGDIWSWTLPDGRIAYRRQLSPKVNLEAFLDLFNMLNQQEAVLTDDNYTYDMVAPIKNGTTADLGYARNINGQPVNVNPNFGKAISYQAPIHGRLGLRLLF